MVPNRRRLLVVDDERIIADTVALIFAQQGYETRAAYSGEEAVSVAAAFSPEVLVSDIKMPGMNGIESAALIVESFPSCCVFLVTGNLSSEFLEDERVLRLGFTLLAKPVPPDVLLAKVADISEQSVRPFTIVNVDDVEVARYVTTRILTKAGFVVKEAGTGAEALVLAKTKPDLILLDVHLPDMSGFDVCRQLRAWPETADIPIVHLTNTCRDEASRQLALEIGANDYLIQPVEPEPFVSLLKTLATSAAAPSL